MPNMSGTPFGKEDANELASVGCGTKAKATDVSTVKTSKAAASILAFGENRLPKLF